MNDQFFQMVPHSQDEVENLYAPVRSAGSEMYDNFMRKSFEPVSNTEFQICKTNETHEEESPQVNQPF